MYFLHVLNTPSDKRRPDHIWRLLVLMVVFHCIKNDTILYSTSYKPRKMRVQTVNTYIKLQPHGYKQVKDYILRAAFKKIIIMLVSKFVGD